MKTKAAPVFPVFLLPAFAPPGPVRASGLATVRGPAAAGVDHQGYTPLTIIKDASVQHDGGSINPRKELLMLWNVVRSIRHSLHANLWIIISYWSLLVLVLLPSPAGGRGLRGVRINVTWGCVGGGVEAKTQS